MDTAQSVESVKEFSFKVLPETNSENFILVVSNPKMEKLYVHLLTGKGESYTEVTSKSELRRRMDMTTAEDGKYTVVVSSGKKTVSKDIELNTATQVVRTLTFK
jgi:hypothetical protein